MDTVTFKKTPPPAWLLAFWKEIDDKTFGKGFDCFAEDAQCRLGVAEWDGREVIRENLRKFIDTGFTAHHDVVDYWDGGGLKIFRGVVTMKFDDPAKPTVKPTCGAKLDFHFLIRHFHNRKLPERLAFPLLKSSIAFSGREIFQKERAD